MQLTLLELFDIYAELKFLSEIKWKRELTEYEMARWKQLSSIKICAEKPNETDN
jgi:hypothetical protein